jgi:hypothetical protein
MPLKVPLAQQDLPQITEHRPLRSARSLLGSLHCAARYAQLSMLRNIAIDFRSKKGLRRNRGLEHFSVT